MAETGNTNTLVTDLIEAGIHFGQRSSNWNPKMGAYIYGKRNHIHIIDIKETIKGLLLAKKFVTKVVADGKDVCFVGTKRQAREVLRRRVGDVGQHWVTERWLGGTLTNFRTIRARLKRLEELERIEESGEIVNYSKKMESQLRRERKKITRNLEGIRNMERLPGAMIVIDVRREVNAILECRKLGIPTVCLIDTDGDPDMADIPIPGNDDSMRSIDVIVRELCAAVSAGKNQRIEVRSEDEAQQAAAAGGAGAGAERPAAATAAGAASAGGEEQAPRRRSRRAMYRSDAASDSESGGGESPAGEPAPAPAPDAADAQAEEVTTTVVAAPAETTSNTEPVQAPEGIGGTSEKPEKSEG